MFSFLSAAVRMKLPRLAKPRREFNVPSAQIHTYMEATNNKKLYIVKRKTTWPNLYFMHSVFTVVVVVSMLRSINGGQTETETW